MITVTITLSILSLSFDELVSLGDLDQEFLLRHHASIVSAATAVFEVFGRGNLLETVPLTGIFGEHSFDQLSERLCVLLIFEYSPKLLLHGPGQALKVRVGGLRLLKR